MDKTFFGGDLDGNRDEIFLRRDLEIWRKRRKFARKYGNRGKRNEESCRLGCLRIPGRSDAVGRRGGRDRNATLDRRDRKDLRNRRDRGDAVVRRGRKDAVGRRKWKGEWRRRRGKRGKDKIVDKIVNKKIIDMGKYRMRKGEMGVDTRKNFKEETIKKSEAMLAELGVDRNVVRTVSGRVKGTNSHFRTYGEDQVVLCKNNNCIVRGGSIEVAARMKMVNELAGAEYRDPVKRAEWEARYKEALRRKKTKMTRLWDWMRDEIRKEIKTGAREVDMSEIIGKIEEKMEEKKEKKKKER